MFRRFARISPRYRTIHPVDQMWGPTKTMNISLEKHMYQVDTGPIALPDLSRRFSPQIGSLPLAFIAFNAPHFADFVVEQPTAVVHEGQEKCQIYHDSAPFSMPAKNVVLGLGN